jgi:thiol-disulfide isomerase/thioredoxin
MRQFVRPVIAVLVNITALVLLGVLVCAAPSGAVGSLAGIWDATVAVNGLQIPFRMELSGKGPGVKGSFFNGDEKVTSSSGRFENGSLVLNFDSYAAKLEATLTEGRLEGRYDRGAGRFYPFQAKRFSPSPVVRTGVPSIAGLWTVEVKGSKREAAWRLIVRQSGAEVSAAILRVDGDTGALTGTFRNGRFLVSHFDGARPLLLELTPAKDGTLAVVQNGTVQMRAVRADEARAKGLPQPTDPSRFTSMKDPSEPLRFSFPDLDGRTISSTDARFVGKVVVISIGGSWCPNCHDEAPFLVEMYRKYHPKGLEIVLLSFEEGDQLKNPLRLRAFIKEYGIEYPVVLAGEPGELNEKIPQAANLNSFPTTFFVGRDGLVRGTHAGFAGRATGQLYTQTTAGIVAQIERLLDEQAPAKGAARSR